MDEFQTMYNEIDFSPKAKGENLYKETTPESNVQLNAKKNTLYDTNGIIDPFPSELG